MQGLITTLAYIFMALNKNNKRLEETTCEQNQHLGGLYISENSKKIRGLIESLKDIDKSHIDKQKKYLIDLKTLKRKEMIRKNFKDIQQSHHVNTDCVPRVFSHHKPLNVGDRYPTINQKNHLLFSDRAFAHEPNIVAGKSGRIDPSHSQQEKKQLISRKFSDYDQIVSDQVGPMRMLLKKKSMVEQQIQTKPSVCIVRTHKAFSNYENSYNQFYRPDENPEKIKKIKDLIDNTQKRIKNRRFHTQGSLSHSKQLPALKIHKKMSLDTEFSHDHKRHVQIKMKTDIS